MKNLYAKLKLTNNFPYSIPDSNYVILNEHQVQVKEIDYDGTILTRVVNFNYNFIKSKHDYNTFTTYTSFDTGFHYIMYYNHSGILVKLYAIRVRLIEEPDIREDNMHFYIRLLRSNTEHILFAFKRSDLSFKRII